MIRVPKLCNFFFIATFFISTVFSDISYGNGVFARDQHTLAPRSIFNPIAENESYVIKDLGLLNVWLKLKLALNKDFLDLEKTICEQVSEQTSVSFDLLEKVTLSNGVLLPCTIDVYRNTVLTDSRNYYALINEQDGRVTVFTSFEYEKAKKYGFELKHEDRLEQALIKAFVVHEEETDSILMQLDERSRLAFGEGDENILKSTGFIEKLGASKLATDFEGQVRQARVFKVVPETVVSIREGDKWVIKKLTEIDGLKVDHASNIAIHVLDRTDKTKLQLALIHEIFARAGVPRSVNDDPNIVELIEKYYKKYLENPVQFEGKAEELVGSLDRLLKESGMDKRVAALSFDVDLNVVRDRDYSKLPPDKRALEVAKQEIMEWKIGNIGGWELPSKDNPSVTVLQEKTLQIYGKYRLFQYSIRDIMTYAFAAFDGNNFKNVPGNVEAILSEVDGLDLDGTPEQLDRLMLHELGREIAKVEARVRFSDADNINFIINKLMFDLFSGEKRTVELLLLEEEMECELKNPGTGKLPVICAMQDIHGAAARAMALVGFALGLANNVLSKVKSLADLKVLLRGSDIEVGAYPVRFVGMNDLFDRGEDPVGSFELVRWLHDEKRLKYIVGNHDFWRMMGVLGVHRYFDKDLGRTDFREGHNKNHHPAFWAEDAWKHAGWGTIEIDQVNEIKVNKKIRGINTFIKRYNATLSESEKVPLLEEIRLRPVREKFSKDLKTMKSYNDKIRRKLIKKTSDLESIDPSLYAKVMALRKSDLMSPEQCEQVDNCVMMDLPDTLTVTTDELEKEVEARNKTIRDIKKQHRLRIRPIRIESLALVDLGNYHKDSGIMERTVWTGKNFRLFYVDIFGFLHLHSVIPFNAETKTIDVEFEGKKGFQALEHMQTRVQKFFADEFPNDSDVIPDTTEWRAKMWRELGDVFTVVNGWYSDVTKVAKPEKVSEFVNVGGINLFGGEISDHTSWVSSFADRSAIMGIVFGHNERKKFSAEDNTMTPLPWNVPFVDPDTFQLLIDFQMSEGYAEEGGMFTILKRDSAGKVTGMKAWGFESKGNVIYDITEKNLDVLNAAQKEFLEELSGNEQFIKQIRRKIEEEERHLDNMANRLLAVIKDGTKYNFDPQETMFMQRMAKREKRDLFVGFIEFMRVMDSGEIDRSNDEVMLFLNEAQRFDGNDSFLQELSRVFADIQEGEEVVSVEEDAAYLKKEAVYVQKAMELLSDLAAEKRDSFVTYFDEGELIFDERKFIKMVALDDGTYVSLKDDKSKERMKEFLSALTAMKRFGLSFAQRERIKKMADGDYFMKWFRVMALKRIYEKECRDIIASAEEAGRTAKRDNYVKIEKIVSAKLERAGVLVKPDIGRAMRQIGVVNKDKNGMFTYEDYVRARFRGRMVGEYAEVISAADKDMTEKNVRKELEMLQKVGIVSAAGEYGKYSVDPVFGGMNDKEMRILAGRIFNVPPDDSSKEVMAEALYGKAVKTRSAMIKELSALQGLSDIQAEGKIVYHLIPMELVPDDQKWMIQKIENVQADPNVKEKIRFLDRSECEQYEKIAADLLDKGFIVDMALLDPSEDDIAKLELLKLKDKGFKALVFSQKEPGNFQQLDGILYALRALQNENRQALEMLYRLLTGTKMGGELEEALHSVDLNDPAEMIKKGIVFRLPPIIIKDHNKLSELNRAMQDSLISA